MTLAQLPAPAAKSGPSVAGWLIVTLAMTLLAVGGGGALGLYIASTGSVVAQSAPPPVPQPYSGDANLRELPSIVTNLADPADSWIRLQAAIVFDAKALPKPDIIVAQISEDLLGYMRTLSAAQIGGASGLQHLREDISERAAIRSDGKVREVIIENLVIQ